MSETKHTPGPWVAVVPDSDFIYGGQDITHFAVYSESAFHDAGQIDNHAIAQTQFTSRIGLETARANARLIATAPDMLRVLEKLSAYVRGEDGDAINAAIAKAKGEA